MIIIYRRKLYRRGNPVRSFMTGGDCSVNKHAAIFLPGEEPGSKERQARRNAFCINSR